MDAAGVIDMSGKAEPDTSGGVDTPSGGLHIFIQEELEFKIS